METFFAKEDDRIICLVYRFMTTHLDDYNPLNFWHHPFHAQAKNHTHFVSFHNQLAISGRIKDAFKKIKYFQIKWKSDH